MGLLAHEGLLDITQPQVFHKSTQVIKFIFIVLGRRKGLVNSKIRKSSHPPPRTKLSKF
jgi:hypothetical protein